MALLRWQNLAGAGSDAFGVATVEEGIELRRARIKQPILVLAGVYLEQLEQFLNHRLTPVVHEVATLKALETRLRKLEAIIACRNRSRYRNGPHRFPAEHRPLAASARQLEAVKAQGIFSHFSDAESADQRYTRKQLKSFRQFRPIGGSEDHASLQPHGQERGDDYRPAAHFSMVRPGLILYGIYPATALKKQIELKPVLSWQTRIIQLKRVPAGTSVGYGQTFVARRNSVIATLPVGYGDGYRRLFSNRARCWCAANARRWPAE